VAMAHATATDAAVTTLTEKDAALACPAPSSLLTLTLHATGEMIDRYASLSSAPVPLCRASR